MQALTQGDALTKFLKMVLGDNATIVPFASWLRAKGSGEVTAEHVDYYYFQQQTDTFNQYIIHQAPEHLHTELIGKQVTMTHTVSRRAHSVCARALTAVLFMTVLLLVVGRYAKCAVWTAITS